MYDPIIQELFPHRQSIPLGKILSSSQPGSSENIIPFPDSEKNPDDFKYSLDYYKGDYDVSYTLTHYGDTFFPSMFARKNLLYLQLLYSASFTPSHYTKREELPSYLLAQTFWGKGVLRYRQKEYELYPDDLFLIDCRDLHEYFADSEEGWGYRFLHFDGTIMPGYYSQITAGQNVKFTFDKQSRFQDLFKEIFSVNYCSVQNKEILTNRILTDMITEVLCQCPQYQDQTLPKPIDNLCSYLQNTFREKLTLDQIAEEVGLSKFYMSREFKKYVGKTIFHYIIDCRIALAQRLLRYSDMTINEVAEYVGFEDHNGFYRAFTQREDMSPSAYRKYWDTF